MPRSRNPAYVLPTITLLLLICGCIPTKQARVAAVALTAQDVARAAAKQSDPNVVREGTPAYLMLMDGLIEAYPDNRELLIAACQAYSSYASSFTSDAEQEQAGALYRKAKLYGFRALSAHADFTHAAAGPLDEFNALLQRFRKEDVPALFWTANAWVSWIEANMDDMEALGDLPVLEATMKRVLELDDSFYYGGPHLFMGTYLAAKPAALGGSLPKAKEHFERAFALGSDKLLTAKVLYARYYARNARDRDLFVRTLEEVLAAPVDAVPELTLANAVAKEQAKKLLDKTEEYFEEHP